LERTAEREGREEGERKEGRAEEGRELLKQEGGEWDNLRLKSKTVVCTYQGY
jgi:hypothetical protein